MLRGFMAARNDRRRLSACQRREGEEAEDADAESVIIDIPAPPSPAVRFVRPFCAIRDISTMGSSYGTRPGLAGQPSLMLNDVLSEEDTNIFHAFDGVNGVIQTVTTPWQLRGARCVGSSCGRLLWYAAFAVPPLLASEWRSRYPSLFRRILALTVPKKQEYEIKNFLYTPISNPNVIFLPSQITLPFHGSDRDRFIRKCVLTFQDAMGVVIICSDGKLAFCEPEDASWSILDSGEGGYADVAFHGGKLHAIRQDHSLVIFDVLGHGDTGKITRLAMLPHPLFSSVGGGDGQTVYLVPSRGNLLMVLRKWKYETRYLRRSIRTFDFKVFKLDCGSSSPRWTEMKSLENRMLFLGNGSRASRSVPKLELAENSIFFTDDNFDGLGDDENRPKKLGDFGLFRLDERSLQPEPSFMCHFSPSSARFTWIG